MRFFCTETAADARKGHDHTVHYQKHLYGAVTDAWQGIRQDRSDLIFVSVVEAIRPPGERASTLDLLNAGRLEPTSQRLLMTFRPRVGTREPVTSRVRDERDGYIRELRAAGRTQQSIADAFGLSRCRIRQICGELVTA